MNSTQPALIKAKKTLRFIWRYFFTLGCIIAAIDAFIYSHPILSRVLITLFIAVAIDWAKQYMKPKRKFGTVSQMRNPYTDIGTPLHIRQWWNPGVIGTGAYDLNRSNIKWDK